MEFKFKVVLLIDGCEFAYLSTESTERKARKQARTWAKDTFPAINKLKISYTLPLK